MNEYMWNICGICECLKGWCYTTLSCMCPLPYSMCISWLLLCNKSLQSLETYNKHLLLLTGLRVSWAVLLTWAWFGRSWCGSHMHLWAGGRLAEAQGGLPQKSDSCFTINKGDSGTEPCVSFSWQCSLIMRSKKRAEMVKASWGWGLELAGTPSLMLYSVGQSESQGQPRFKGWGN